MAGCDRIDKSSFFVEDNYIDVTAWMDVALMSIRDECQRLQAVVLAPGQNVGAAIPVGIVSPYEPHQDSHNSVLAVSTIARVPEPILQVRKKRHTFSRCQRFCSDDCRETCVVSRQPAP